MSLLVKLDLPLTSYSEGAQLDEASKAGQCLGHWLGTCIHSSQSSISITKNLLGPGGWRDSVMEQLWTLFPRPPLVGPEGVQCRAVN